MPDIPDPDEPEEEVELDDPDPAPVATIDALIGLVEGE